jgi:WD40 repeat protein
LQGSAEQQFIASEEARMLGLLPSVRWALWAGLLVALPFLADGGAAAQDKLKVEVVPQLAHAGRGTIFSVAFSPDGRAVLSGGGASLKLWDVTTGQLVRTFEGHYVFSVAFSPGGRSVLSGGADKTLKLWDLATGQLIRAFEGHGDKVAAVAFSPDGRRVLSGSDDRTVKLWDLATGQLIRAFEGHGDKVTAVAFSPDGRRVLSGSDDRTVKLWEAATGQLVQTFEGDTGLWSRVAFSPDGRNVLSTFSKTLKLWDAATGRLLRTFEGHSWGVSTVAFAPDGRTLVSGGLDWDGTLRPPRKSTVKLWDVASGQLLRTFEDAVADRLANENGEDGVAGVPSLAFSPDGGRVLASWGKTLKLWDIATGLMRTFEGQGGAVDAVAFSPDGRAVLSGTYGSPLKLWDATSGRLVRTFEGRLWATSVAFSADGRRVLVGFDTTFGLWDATTGRHVRTFDDNAKAALSLDGRTVLSGDNSGTLKLWDAGTGDLLRAVEQPGEYISAVAFSPDGRNALSAGGTGAGALKLWDVATGGQVRTFEGHLATVLSVAFSPDGQSVLSGSDTFPGSTDNLKLWDLASGRLLRSFEGHTGAVMSVAFSPDGRSVLSGGQDQTLKLWDAATGRLLRTFDGHSSEVNKVAFSPDGRSAISGASDGTVRFWSLASGREVVRLIESPGGDWLTLTPAGFFDSQGDLDKFVHLVRGMEIISIGQVHQSLFNPDLVREALGGDLGSEMAEAAKVINLDKVVGSGPAPDVAIASPAEGSQSATDLITVTARIEDRGKGVGRIEWRVNGVTAAVGTKPAHSGPVYTVKQQLALDPGDNAIEVVAYNGMNLLASLPARTTTKFTGPVDKTKPKLHILAIGINAYVDKGWAPSGKDILEFAPLGLAVKDAESFAASMKKATAGLYDEVRIMLALDKDATRANLEKIVARIAREVQPRDSFILFAAGHGTSENGRFYLIPQDYQSGPGHLAQRAISQDRLQDWLANRIKARRAIILLDTCESGALVGGHTHSRTDAPASEAAVGRLHEATGRPVLTAAAAGQFAHEGLIGETGERHGVFTWALLDALRNGDSNGNGLIELSELVRHVQSVVPKVAAGMVRAATSEPVLGKQAARFGSRGEDFVVAERLQ